MKVCKLLAALAFLVGGLCAAAPAGDQVMLPEQVFPQLDVMLKSAVQQSPRMLSRALDLEIAENNRIQTHAGLLPTVGSYFSYYKASDDRADLSGRHIVDKIAYNITLTQPLYHWGELKNTARMGEIQASITQGQYREAYRLLAQELRASYLRLIVQKLALRRARFYLDYTQNQLSQQEDRFTKKVISEVEISVARLTAEQAQLAAERTEFDYETAKASFARLAGTTGLADEAIPDSIPAAVYAPGAFSQLLAGFLAQKDPPTLEANTLRHLLEIENLNYQVQKTRLRPKLNAVVGTSQDEQTYSLNVAQKYRVNSIFAGLAVNWMIFDGFSSGAIVRTSLARRHQLENDYRQVTERLAQDAQSQVKLINFSARSMAIYDRFLVSGEGYLRTIQDDFKRGVKSEADVSLAQISLYDAQVNAGNARSDYLAKVGDFLGIVVQDPILANVADK